MSKSYLGRYARPAENNRKENMGDKELERCRELAMSAAKRAEYALKLQKAWIGWAALRIYEKLQ